VSYLLLPWILEQEGSAFKQVHQHWRPTTLILVRQARILIKDMRRRLDYMEKGKDELQMLPRADRYGKYLHRMRISYRDANFQWKADQLSFLNSVDKFYQDYGAVLRLLKFDQAMGRFLDKPKGA